MVEKYNKRLSSGGGRSYDLRPQNTVLWQEYDQTLSRMILKYEIPCDKVLIVGCGYGAEVYGLLRVGVEPRAIYCADILRERIEALKSTTPQLGGIYLGPYTKDVFSEQFDLILCCTVLSSISNDDDRTNLLNEMAASLKPAGRLFIYDIAFDNPNNKDVRRVDFASLPKLTGLQLTFLTRLTILPSLARNLVVRPMRLTAFARSFFPLRTHKAILLTRGL